SFDQTFSKVWPPAGLNSRRGAPACAPVFDGITVEIKELERVEINLSDEGVYDGYLVVADQLRELPIGSTLDKSSRVFYWQPGPGFVGEYRFVFIEKDNEGQFTQKHIVVNIKTKQ
ncbi:MAG: Fibronectin type-III protein, partial [Acidobacteriota bacterium]|nr:Fibronectin type-III protein [Acidobacteriota bacterium]